MEKRNLAIIAHVDHGKTTLVDQLLKQSGLFRENESVRARVLDSDDLEIERGITIISKNCAIRFEGIHINLIDTPGHADFGGEVERVLSMVDGVLLLVDAVEGPMPQTRFVTSKALRLGLNPIVVVNKIDRIGSRPDWVIDETFELFDKLGATETQLDFPVIFTSALNGFATSDHQIESTNMEILFKTIVEKVRPPSGEKDEPFRMQICSLDYSSYLGKIGIGKIVSGRLDLKQDVTAIDGPEGVAKKVKVSRIEVFEGLGKKEVGFAEVGDIVLVSGIDELNIGTTLCDSNHLNPLEMLTVDEPTLGVNFLVNTSPFAGREGKYVTGRQIRERLEQELKKNVALRVNFSEEGDSFEVFGRGELHLTILLENLRREGYEVAVSKPRVVFKKSDNGNITEPYENLVVDINIEHQGAVMEALGDRKASLLGMDNELGSRVRLHYSVSARALLGFQSDFLSMTKGTGILSHSFDRYDKFIDDLKKRNNGVLISQVTGKAVGYALWKLQERGRMLVNPGDEIYEGMIVGIHSRDNDLVVNPIKEKKLTNVRASGKDEHIDLITPIKLTLEKALEFIAEDELIEVTPQNLRVRKKELSESQRRKSSREK